MSDNQKPYIPNRTGVPCVECSEGKLIQDSPTTAFCDHCHEEFLKEEDSNLISYKDKKKK